MQARKDLTNQSAPPLSFTSHLSPLSILPVFSEIKVHFVDCITLSYFWCPLYIEDPLRGKSFLLLFSVSKLSADVRVSPGNAQFLIALPKIQILCFAWSVQFELLLKESKKVTLNFSSFRHTTMQVQTSLFSVTLTLQKIFRASVQSICVYGNAGIFQSPDLLQIKFQAQMM